jgi:hypothetical protein
VTLWHRNDPTAAVELHDRLMACAGQEVQLQLLAVDISPELTAAQVREGCKCLVDCLGFCIS